MAGASALVGAPALGARATGQAGRTQVEARPAIDPARLRNRLERLSYHGRPPAGGFGDGESRVAYSVADLTARA